MDPRSGRKRRAIEVYPHPATVVLFGLGKTLKYKAKPGPQLSDLLRSELLLLMDHVERARAPTERTWRDLRTQVETATRKVDLRQVEDQVDAVVCAYVALFAERWPGADHDVRRLRARLHRHPDAARRARHDPAAVEEYTRPAPARVQDAHEYVALVTEILDEAGINYLTVTGRAKSIESFAAKAGRTVDGVPVYADPLRDITDQIGVRVITYVRSDVAAVADVLGSPADRARRPRPRPGDRERGPVRLRQPAPPGRPRNGGSRAGAGPGAHRPAARVGGVRARHPLQGHGPGGARPRLRPALHPRRRAARARRPGVHDHPRPAPRRLRRRARDRRPTATRPRELAAYLAGQYPDAEWSRTDHYAWIAGLLPELGITTLAALGEVLAGIDADQVTARMDYRYPPGAVRRLDDALLAAFGERYVDLPGNAHRGAARHPAGADARAYDPSLSGCRCSRVASSRRSASLPVSPRARALAASASSSRPRRGAARRGWRGRGGSRRAGRRARRPRPGRG